VMREYRSQRRKDLRHPWLTEQKPATQSRRRRFADTDLAQLR